MSLSKTFMILLLKMISSSVSFASTRIRTPRHQHIHTLSPPFPHTILERSVALHKGIPGRIGHGIKVQHHATSQQKSARTATAMTLMCFAQVGSKLTKYQKR